MFITSCQDERLIVGLLQIGLRTSYHFNYAWDVRVLWFLLWWGHLL